MLEKEHEVLDKVQGQELTLTDWEKMRSLVCSYVGGKVLGRENRKYKGPKARAPWEYLRNI